MKFQTYDDFNFRGAATLPNGDFVAVGIAPQSEVDILKVGAYTLGVGQLVPASDNIVALRSFRTGIPNDSRIGGHLALVLYEKCDALVAPGPRVPALADALVRNADDYATAPFRALRLPFAGRTQAAFFVRRISNLVDPLTCIVRGVRYLPRALDGKATSLGGVYDVRSNGSNDEPHFAEVVEAMFWSQSVANPAVVEQQVGGVFYVGGNGDNQESFDELELWVSGTENGDVICQAEATGERGR